jgi:hypothetical protein
MADKGDSPHNTMDPIIVTIPGVEKLLKNIKPYKATGPDSIPGVYHLSVAKESPLRTLVSCL